MEFKDLFAGIVLSLVAVIGFIAFANGLNEKYAPLGGNQADTASFNTVLANLSIFTSGKGEEAGETSDSPSVANSADDSLITRGLKTMDLIKDFFGFIPKMLREAGNRLGIPKPYIDAAQFLFWFSLAATIMYLIFLGVQKIRG